jgi:hypothetical protein
MLKSILWTKHAQKNMAARKIDQSEAERTIRQPDNTEPDPPGRKIHMRRYYDELLDKDMLLRVVVAESATVITVITVYKTSQFGRYLRGQEE